MPSGFNASSSGVLRSAMNWLLLRVLLWFTAVELWPVSIIVEIAFSLSFPHVELFRITSKCLALGARFGFRVSRFKVCSSVLSSSVCFGSDVILALLYLAVLSRV